MKNIILLAIIITGYSQIHAQIKATTESGNTVILHKNGTWEYYEAGMDKTQAPSETAIVTTVATTALNIDTTANIKSERFELFNDVSPKMARYFGEEKGKVRCYSTFANKKGQILLSFEINIPVGDGYRYFGRTLEEQSIILELDNDLKITIPITEDLDTKYMDKWNQSYFTGSGIISEKDLNSILNSQLENVFIDWKKNPETYRVTNGDILKKSIKEIL